MITFWLNVISLIVFFISGIIMLWSDEVPKGAYACTWTALIACLVERCVSSYGL